MPSELQRVLAEGRNVTSLESFRRLIHVKKNDSTPFISLVDRVELSSTTAGERPVNIYKVGGGEAGRYT